MSISEKLASMSPKNRQYLLLGGAASAILFLSFLSASLLGGNPAPQVTTSTSQQDAEPTNIATPGAAANPKDIWMEQSSAQMQQMNEVIKGLKEQMATMESSKPEAGATSESLLPPLPPLVQPPQPQVTSMPEIEPLPQEPPREPGIASFEVSQAPVQT